MGLISTTTKQIKESPAYLVSLVIFCFGMAVLIPESSSIIGAFFLMPFALWPLVISMMVASQAPRRSSQNIITIGSVLYAAWFGYTYLNAFYWNLDPQSGLALIFVGIYSLPVMFPLWLIAMFLSRGKKWKGDHVEKSIQTGGSSGGPIACLLLMSIPFVTGCSGRMSEHYPSAHAGLNGGFEGTQSGYPVNWMLYTPKTVPGADFDLLMDEGEVQSGERSLKVVVRDCSDVGGWRSPGFCRELKAKPGATYKIQFWVKQDSGTFTFQAGGINAKRGDYSEKQIVSESSGSWKQYTYTCKVPEAYERLRLEWNAIQPGQYWIDGLTVEEVSEMSERVLR